MSLGIAFKAPEGIILAADSRVTLSTKTVTPSETIIHNSTYDNATKLLRVNGQDHVGAITYGIGSINTPEPRTAHSFIPEVEKHLFGLARLTVEEFAKELSSFFMGRWTSTSNPIAQGQDMIFLVGGYDDGAAFGRIFEFGIPNRPTPVERVFPANFGLIWGGQQEYVDMLMNGHDARLPIMLQAKLGLTDMQRDDLMNEIQNNFASKIPFAFLPLQDCVDLVIFLIRTTITMQHWLLGVRGVGGAIDVAVITPAEGIREIQRKSLSGE